MIFTGKPYDFIMEFSKWSNEAFDSEAFLDGNLRIKPNAFCWIVGTNILTLFNSYCCFTPFK